MRGASHSRPNFLKLFHTTLLVFIRGVSSVVYMKFCTYCVSERIDEMRQVETRQEKNYMS